MPDAGHEGWDSPCLHLDFAPLCPLLKEKLRLGFVARNVQVGVLERLPFLALPGAQPPSRFFAHERGEASLRRRWQYRLSHGP